MKAFQRELLFLALNMSVGVALNVKLLNLLLGQVTMVIYSSRRNKKQLNMVNNLTTAFSFIKSRNTFDVIRSWVILHSLRRRGMKM